MTELLLACAYENKIDDFQQLPNLGFERRGNARKKLFFWFPLGEGQGRDVAQGFTVNCLLNRSLMNAREMLPMTRIEAVEFEKHLCG